MTVVGLVGFLSSAIYAVALVDDTSSLQNNTVIFASIIGGIGGSTIVPLIVATVLAYCVTGYVRDELYHPFVKMCVGASYSVWVVILTFVYFLIWLGLSVILSMVVAVYISLEMGCDDVTGDPPCFTLVEGSEINLRVCGDLGDLCSVGLKIGLSLSIALGFSIVVAVGLVLILTVQAANFVSVRESNKRSYRPGGDY